MSFQFYHNQPSWVYPKQFELGSNDGLPNLDIQVLSNLSSPFPLQIPSLDKTRDGYVRPYSALTISRYGSVELRRVPTDIIILERIRVVAEMQNRGVGTELMKRALADVDRVNATVMTVVRSFEPNTDLSRLVDFFTSFEFEVIASEVDKVVMFRQSLSQREQAQRKQANG